MSQAEPNEVPKDWDSEFERMAKEVKSSLGDAGRVRAAKVVEAWKEGCKRLGVEFDTSDPQYVDDGRREMGCTAVECDCTGPCNGLDGCEPNDNPEVPDWVIDDENEDD
jgi:hypothetical protein